MKVSSALLRALAASFAVVTGAEAKCRPHSSGSLSDHESRSSSSASSALPTASSSSVSSVAQDPTYSASSSMSSASAAGTETSSSTLAASASSSSGPQSSQSFSTNASASSTPSVTSSATVSLTVTSTASVVSLSSTSSTASTDAGSVSTTSSTPSDGSSSSSTIDDPTSSSEFYSATSSSGSYTTSSTSSDLYEPSSTSTLTTSETATTSSSTGDATTSSSFGDPTTSSSVQDATTSSSAEDATTSSSVGDATSSSSTSDATTSSDSRVATTSSSSGDATASSSTTESSSSSTTFNVAEYTYYEAVELPTVTVTYDAVTTPTTTEVYSISQTPSPSCFIDSSSLDQTFKVTSGSVPLIPKNGRIGILEGTDFPNTDEAANEAFFNNLPTYHFEAPSGGPSGFYDLVTTNTNGDVVYVALDPSSMEIHTSATSSLGQTPDANGFVTTIFSFSCDGRIVISDEGTVYTWSTGPDGVNTVLTVGAPSTDNQILLVPTAKPPGYTADAASTSSDGNLSPRHPRYASMPLERRKSPYTDGALPRVPYWPPNLISKSRGDARNMTANGCGSGSTSAWIPQLNFGTCCNYHDYCYDNCEGGIRDKCNSGYCSPSDWERCNSAFYDCMHQTACPEFSWIWRTARRVQCEIEASFYAWVVTTYKGADAFKEANSERCGAFCFDGNPLCHGQCMDFTGNDNDNCGGCNWKCATGYSFQCRSGQCVCTADVQNDNKNCGFCGRKCPYKTHCSNGSCKCDDDQCGNLCVDLKSHPRNCGTCGKVCSTGYCFQGQCVDAAGTSTDSAPKCLPTDAIKNGGFDTIQSSSSASPWDFHPLSSTLHTISYGPNDLATSKPNLASITSTDGYYTGVSYLTQNITLCPGANYELTLSLGGVTFRSNKCLVQIGVLNNQVLTNTYLAQTTTGMKGYGPYAFTVPAAPAGGGTGWKDTDNFGAVEYDSSGTFAYTQFRIIVSGAALNCRDGFKIDDVSIYQP